MASRTSTGHSTTSHDRHGSHKPHRITERFPLRAERRYGSVPRTPEAATGRAFRDRAAQVGDTFPAVICHATPFRPVTASPFLGVHLPTRSPQTRRGSGGSTNPRRERLPGLGSLIDHGLAGPLL